VWPARRAGVRSIRIQIRPAPATNLPVVILKLWKELLKAGEEGVSPRPPAEKFVEPAPLPSSQNRRLIARTGTAERGSPPVTLGYCQP
jgi:hypothetical protein